MILQQQQLLPQQRSSSTTKQNSNNGSRALQSSLSISKSATLAFVTLASLTTTTNAASRVQQQQQLLNHDQHESYQRKHQLRGSGPPRSLEDNDDSILGSILNGGSGSANPLLDRVKNMIGAGAPGEDNGEESNAAGLGDSAASLLASLMAAGKDNNDDGLGGGGMMNEEQPPSILDELENKVEEIAIENLMGGDDGEEHPLLDEVEEIAIENIMGGGDDETSNPLDALAELFGGKDTEGGGDSLGDMVKGFLGGGNDDEDAMPNEGEEGEDSFGTLIDEFLDGLDGDDGTTEDVDEAIDESTAEEIVEDIVDEAIVDFNDNKGIEEFIEEAVEETLSDMDDKIADTVEAYASLAEEVFEGEDSEGSIGSVIEEEGDELLENILVGVEEVFEEATGVDLGDKGNSIVEGGDGEKIIEDLIEQVLIGESNIGEEGADAENVMNELEYMLGNDPADGKNTTLVKDVVEEFLGDGGTGDKEAKAIVENVIGEVEERIEEAEENVEDVFGEGNEEGEDAAALNEIDEEGSTSEVPDDIVVDETSNVGDGEDAIVEEVVSGEGNEESAGEEVEGAAALNEIDEEGSTSEAPDDIVVDESSNVGDEEDSIVEEVLEEVVEEPVFDEEESNNTPPDGIVVDESDVDEISNIEDGTDIIVGEDQGDYGEAPETESEGEQLDVDAVAEESDDGRFEDENDEFEIQVDDGSNVDEELEIYVEDNQDFDYDVESPENNSEGEGSPVSEENGDDLPPLVAEEEIDSPTVNPTKAPTVSPTDSVDLDDTTYDDDETYSGNPPYEGDDEPTSVDDTFYDDEPPIPNHMVDDLGFDKDENEEYIPPEEEYTDFVDPTNEDESFSPNMDVGSNNVEQEAALNGQYSDADKTFASKLIGIIMGIFALFGMIFTAHQMQDNPDGVFASCCRLMITVSSCILRGLAFPCRSACGGGGPGRSKSGHSALGAPDYRDDYRQRHGVLELA